MTITSAVKDLYIELEAGEDADAALKFVCEEYELNPLLVARKFAEQYGVSHTQWAPPQLVASPPRRVIDFKNLTPKQVAVEWSKQFDYPLGESVKIGKRFNFYGDEFLFVHFRNNFDTGYIKAVEVATGKKMRLRWQIEFGDDKVLSQIYS